VAKLTASDSSFGFEYFGWGVAIDDGHVLVGAPGGGTLLFTGAAYVYPVPRAEPVCRVSADAHADGITLDFRLRATVPVDWSVWAWVGGRLHPLWTTPLAVSGRPFELSVPLGGLPAGIWFLSALSTTENGVVCADVDRAR
jgi:hypothetical protein